MINNKLKKIVGIGALILTLSGCFREKRLEGKVISEKLETPIIKGYLFGMPEYPCSYTDTRLKLEAETKEGKYTLTLRDLNHKIPVEELEEKIQHGDNISFPLNYKGGRLYLGGNKYKRVAEFEYFDENNVGSMSTEVIEVINGT